MRSLWPPIEVIASNLQPGNEPALHFHSQTGAGSESDADAVTSDMPAFILDKVRKRVASRSAKFDTYPKSGQIWRFDGHPDDLIPLCVLIDHELGNHRWSGWITAPEVDYACNKDVLLEPKDEPFDPLAAMVQTWNPVEVDIRKASRVLAELSPDRLDAIRELVSNRGEEGGGARPGFVAPLKMPSGASLLSGTRITHPEDPRNKYQALYLAAARALESQLGTSKIIQLPKRRDTMRKAGWAIAASVILAQAVIIANVMQSPPAIVGSSEDLEYRAIPKQSDGAITIEVFFKSDVREIEIRKLLTMLNARIVDGPGDFGQYRLQVKEKTSQEAISKLISSGLTDSVSNDQ
jgi:hypothetical protein